MITLADILDKASRLYYKVISSQLAGNDVFPLKITGNKKLEGDNYSDWKKSLVPLYDHSKAVKAKSYSVEWKQQLINGSRQQVPATIFFETLEDFLYFVKKEKEFNHICNAKQLITQAFSSLESWAITNPALLARYTGQWNNILKVLQYFSGHQPPHPYYIRELPIAVHSKFIETNTGILKQLLDIILPEDGKDANTTDFAGRYFIKKPNVLTQIRILDDTLKPLLGYDECSLTIEDAAFLQWVPEKVFIIENQACYLSFPRVSNAVAIFGEGFKSRLSRHIPWLNKTRLFCWFDLDASGFEMLNMIRSHYPEAKSIFMDINTFNAFSNFTVPDIKKYKQLHLLNIDEQELYGHLIQYHLRLEQERISQQYVMENL